MVLLRYRKISENNRMFPSKSMDYCVGESSRFFPTNRMDGDTSNMYTSPFQTPIANRYSSSTDSTSPESYFNTPFQITPSSEYNRPGADASKSYSARPDDSQPLFHDSPTHIYGSPLPNFNVQSSATYNRNMTSSELHYDNTNAFERYTPGFEPRNQDQGIGDTPFQLRRQRAIVGRKILGTQSRASFELSKPDNDMDFNIWQPLPTEESQSHYELFPYTHKSYEFYAQKKSSDFRTSPTSSVKSSSFINQMSPNKSQYDKWSAIPNRVHTAAPIADKMTSPNINIIPSQTNMVPYPEFKPPYNPPLYAGASSTQDAINANKMCTFCRKNGETPSVYMKHCVKEKVDNRYVVTCPILRALVCVTCGASGDNAHTITYCPLLRHNNNGKPLQSTTITLKNTRIKSNGRKRY